MTWNRVIDRAKQETSYCLGGHHSHKRTEKDAIVLNIVMVVNDDGVPIIWSIQGKQLEPRNESMELLKALLT